MSIRSARNGAHRVIQFCRFDFEGLIGEIGTIDFRDKSFLIRNIVDRDLTHTQSATTQKMNIEVKSFVTDFGAK